MSRQREVIFLGNFYVTSDTITNELITLLKTSKDVKLFIVNLVNLDKIQIYHMFTLMVLIL